MCGGGDFAAQLHNGIRSAYRIQISATGEFFLDGQYVDLLAGMIHRHEGGEDQFVVVVVEHFRA